MPYFFYCIKDLFLCIGSKWDKLSPNINDAIEFAHDYINKEPANKIDQHHYSMEYYLAHYGANINDRYRKDKPDKEDVQVSEMIDKNLTKRDIVLYRGVCKEVFKCMQEKTSDMKNIDLYEKGFLSCSLVKGKEESSSIRLRIFVPAESKAIYLGSVNNEQEYYEVVIMRGAKLQIISKDCKYFNCKLIATE